MESSLSKEKGEECCNQQDWRLVPAEYMAASRDQGHVISTAPYWNSEEAQESLCAVVFGRLVSHCERHPRLRAVPRV